MIDEVMSREKKSGAKTRSVCNAGRRETERRSVS